MLECSALCIFRIKKTHLKTHFVSPTNTPQINH